MKLLSMQAVIVVITVTVATHTIITRGEMPPYLLARVFFNCICYYLFLFFIFLLLV